MRCQRATRSAAIRTIALTVTLMISGVTVVDTARAASSGHTDATGTPSRSGPARVRIVRHAGTYRLMVDGEPYVVHGAGMGFGDAAGVATLAAHGGNTFRTWEPANIDAQLEAARANGLMVLVGLDVQKQLQGFDYGDTAAVQAQYEDVTAFIDHYKDDPVILGWILANEPNLMIDDSGQTVPADAAVYEALGDILDYIRANDPNHPATVAFAFTPSLDADIAAALGHMPSLDFVSLQAYGALSAIPERVAAMPGDWPFMITEFGPLGHWEMPATDWGREIEEPSGLKARGMNQRMEPVVKSDATGRLIGSFAFLWGQKQERTPTWYGLFTARGERTASVDELTRWWTGQYPDNRAPSAWSIVLDGKSATDSVRLQPGKQAEVTVTLDDPEAERLVLRWELMREVEERSDGGHFEAEPARVPLELIEQNASAEKASVRFTTPAEPGDYRLYLYATDAHGGAATANFPFLVL